MKKLLALTGIFAIAAAMPALANDMTYFNKMDKNGDKIVSKDEYMAFGEAKFDMKDTNNDGRLSMSEFETAKKKKHAGKGKHSSMSPAAGGGSATSRAVDNYEDNNVKDQKPN